MSIPSVLSGYSVYPFTFDPALHGTNITVSGNQATASILGYQPALSEQVFTPLYDFIAVIGPTGDTVSPALGLANVSVSLTNYLGSDVNGMGIGMNGNVTNNMGIIGNTGVTYAVGDTLRIQLNSSNQFRISKNGGAYSSFITCPVVGALRVGVTLNLVSSYVIGEWTR